MTAVLAFVRRWWKWLAASFVVAGVVQAVRSVAEGRRKRLEAEALAELAKGLAKAETERLVAHDAKIDALTQGGLEAEGKAGAAIAEESDQEATANAGARIAQSRKERESR